jgi:magnesium transporter
MLRSVIRAWRYVVGRDGREQVDPAHIREAVDPKKAVVWIDATSPEDEKPLHALKAELGFGATVVDAILNPSERTKLMRYGDYFHVAVHDCACAHNSVDSREIDVVTGPGWMVTVRHPSDNGSQVDLDEVARRFEMQRTEHHATEEGFLLWALFDVIVDRYFEVVDTIDERLDDIEEAVFREPPPPGIPQTTFEVRRDLTTIRRASAPMREVVNAIIRKEIDFVDDEAIVYFHDIYDRVLRVGDLVESQRDLLTGLLEANLAVTSNQLNQVMKKMTSWGAILIVATLIAGIYGMNFSHMPELQWEFGYPLALGFMALATFVLWRWFKKKGWL